MPKFTHAWCETEQRTLTPYEVRDLWELKRREPVLQCPDERCRREHPASRIIPVCCNPDEPCEKRMPHFRTGPEHKHGEDCLYSTLAEALEHVMAHKKEYKGHNGNSTNLLQELNGVSDTSLLADEYLTEYDPRNDIHEIKTKAENLIRKGANKKEAFRIALACTPQRTGSLKRIVEMCELLDHTGERGKAFLSLPGRKKPATYESAFFYLSNLRIEYKSSYIFFGAALIFSYENGYLIKYIDPLRKYHRDFPNICAFTPLDSALCSRMLLRDLEYYTKEKRICYVYTFSDHVLKETSCDFSDRRSCAVISPKASDAVVIRAICVKHP